MKAVRIRDSISGSVSHHAGHVIGMTSGKNPQPIYCSGHSVTGRQQDGANKTYIEGQLAARLNDTGTTNCPCDGRDYNIASASRKVFIEGKAAARKNDKVNIHGAGSGTFTSSSSKVFIGG